MKYSVAEATRILADWKPKSSEQRADDDEAARSLLNKDGGFRKTLLARLRWACLSRPDISSRFPINPRRSAARVLDEHLLEELAQEIFMLLLEPGEPFGLQNAFGVLKGRMDKCGEGDWPDVDCLVFLLGKEGKQYLLPRPGQSVGDCPAIWRWVAMKWRAGSQRQWESDTILRRTGLPGGLEMEAGQRVIGQHNGTPLLAQSRSEVPDANVRNVISEVQKWPAEQRKLLLEEQRWKAGQFRELKRDAPYFQAAFRVRLAGKLQDLGFGVERKRDDFEIAGLPADVLKRFSRRTALIEKVAEERGITDPDRKAELGAETREKKGTALGWERLRKEWNGLLSDRERDVMAKVHRRERVVAKPEHGEKGAVNGKAVQLAVVAEKNPVAAVPFLQRRHDSALRSITPMSGQSLYQDFTTRPEKRTGQGLAIIRKSLPCN